MAINRQKYVDLYFDYVCPWCYLMHAELKRQQFIHEINFKPFPLQPQTPQVGKLITEIFGGEVDLEDIHARVWQLFDESKLPYTKTRNKIYNTRAAQELTLWAATKNKALQLADEIYAAYFERNENISEILILKSIVSKADLDHDEAEEILDKGYHSAELESLWLNAQKNGIHGVPALVANHKVLSGFQPKHLPSFFKFSDAK